MSETLMQAMHTMCMGKDPVRTKQDLLQFLKSQKTVQYQDKIQPIVQDWQKRIASNWWGTGYTGLLSEREQSMLQLRDLLLSIDGYETCLPIQDPDLENIMEYGQLWVGQKRIRLMKGEACQCHKNSAYLWKANKNYRAGIFGIATGYALSADGMWRQHSWCVLRKPRSYQIVETTTPRELYFGVCMLYEDAEWFCNNILIF